MRFLTGAVLSAFLLSASSAAADPLRVTGGALTGSDSSVTDFLMTGDGFEVGGITWSTLDDEPHYECGYCQAGDSVSLSMRYDRFDDGGVTYNGTTYGDARGLFTFLSDTVTLPDAAPGTSGSLARAFTFAGHLMGPGPGGTLALTGSGEARITFISRPASGQEPAHIDITRLSYTFQDTEPVPEPATMLLLGSGLAGLAAARRRTLRRRSEPRP